MAPSTTVPTKSCLDCPSFLTTVDAAGKFGKSIGSAQCARYAYPLAMPNATNEANRRTAEMLAENCPGYGRPAPVRPDDIRTEVALPDPGARIELGDLDPKKSVVKTCAQCANLINEELVEAATGWTASVCAAKGRLIPANKKKEEATGCQFRRPGRAPTVMLGNILPAWQAPKSVAAKAADAEFVEPLEYPTDREVTPDEEAKGIKAWRELKDPEGSGNSVMLPIFDPKHFTQEQRDLIPQSGDQENPQLYVDHNGAVYRIAVLWMELDETPAAWGMPGVGKTEVARHLAWLMQIPFYRFSIKESTEVAELEGFKEFDPQQGTYFRDGRFTEAWQSISVVCVDEPNMGRSEVWAFLRPCFDNSKQLVIDADGGRNAPRNEFCFPMVSMNPAWSPTNVGANQIGAADASRLMHIQFSLPEEEVERKIIKNRIKVDGWLIDNERLNLVMSISTAIRNLVEDGTLSSLTWGIRENLKVARALRWFTPLIAYQMGAADYLEPQQRDVVLDQVRAHASGNLPKVMLIEEED